MADFPYRTPPFAPYQRDTLMQMARAPYWYVAWEQGTGKSWLTINNAGYLWMKGQIDAMIVLAPNGVHSAWILDQVPAHMPLGVPYRGYAWQSSDERAAVLKADTKSKLSPNVRRLLTPPSDGSKFFPILAVNSEAVGAVKGAQKAVELMLRTFRCLLVLDEASDFATPSSSRTRAVQRWRKLAPYRRCLDGTPTGGEPWDLWAQYRFLDSRIIGVDTYALAKNRYGVWIERQLKGQLDTRGRPRVFKVLKQVGGVKQFQHLDELQRKISVCTSRVTKAEALPHLPSKLFQKRYFDLTPEQRRMTDELKQQLQTMIEGKTVTATHVLTNILRRQQVACGYVPTDKVWANIDEDVPTEVAEPMSIIPGPNPRLELALEEIQRQDPRRNPMIIWTRYKFDIDLLLPHLTTLGYRVAVYDGRTKRADRDVLMPRFQAGEFDIWLANAAAGSRGLNLYRATRVLYYSNYFGLRRRLQSEDRAHRIGTVENVLYTDILGRRTVDDQIVSAFRQQRSVSDTLLGDTPYQDWL